MPADRHARIDQRDRADRTEPALAAEPTERMLPAEATEPIERIDPAEPMLRIEPAEPMDRIDPLDPILNIEPFEPFEPVSRCALPVIPMPRIISVRSARVAGDATCRAVANLYPHTSASLVKVRGRAWCELRRDRGH